eukprot:gene37310-48939_t
MGDGIRLWETSAWTGEIELLLGVLLLWRVAERPCKDKWTEALTIRLHYMGPVPTFHDGFQDLVRDEAAAAERQLRAGIRSSARLRFADVAVGERVRLTPEGCAEGVVAHSAVTVTVHWDPPADGGPPTHRRIPE